MINGAVLEEEAVLPLDDARAIARFFQVLSDPTRVRLVKALVDGKWCVSLIAPPTPLQMPAMTPSPILLSNSSPAFASTSVVLFTSEAGSFVPSQIAWTSGDMS